MYGNCKVKDLIGQTMASVVNKDNIEVIFTTTEGQKYKMNHSQDCCESVSITNIDGDLSNLVDSVILEAEEEVHGKQDEMYPVDSGDSFTWTLYRFATAKGRVIISWLGVSNGYYSESVDLWKE